ncbi:MAG: uroporphyrinogen-III synthase [Rhodobacterales bacterium]|nr:MAG: uroporphyrinogen-III synthase [Rhodobacterales bacterium]
MTPALLLTRPKGGSARVLRAVELSLGREVPHVVSPLLDIVDLPVTADLSAIPILTSEQGARRAGGLGYQGRAYCVGDRTAAMARAQGMRPISAGGTSDDLVKMIRAAAPETPLIHIRGRHTRGDVVERLRMAGLPASDAVAYEQIARPLSRAARALLESGSRVVAPVFSPRSAELLAKEIAGPHPDLRIVAISENAANAFGGKATVAEKPEMAGMVAAICLELSP